MDCRLYNEILIPFHFQTTLFIQKWVISFIGGLAPVSKQGVGPNYLQTVQTHSRGEHYSWP